MVRLFIASLCVFSLLMLLFSVPSPRASPENTLRQKIATRYSIPADTISIFCNASNKKNGAVYCTGTFTLGPSDPALVDAFCGQECTEEHPWP